MKAKLFLISVFFVQLFFAQTSTVTIFSEEGERFFVIVNGVRQNDSPATNVVVTDLDKPNYLFKIIFEDQKINSINENVYLLDFDDKRVNLSYNLKKNKKGKMVMRPNSFDYDTNKKPAKDTQVVKYHTEENPIVPAKNPAKTDTFSEKVDIDMMGINVNTEVIDDGENVNMNINMGGLQTGVNVTTTTTQTTTTTTTKPMTTTKPVTTKPVKKPTIHMEEVMEVEEVKKPVTQPTSRACRVAMNSTAFQAAKTSVSKQSFSETKMKTAKQVLNGNCMSTAQIVDMMGLFSFEGDKLEFAKSAYAKCTDKGNYFMVNDAFTFSASVSELSDYIDGLSE